MRYRYDAEKPRRYKTVELIIEEAAWQPQLTTADTLMANPRVEIITQPARRSAV